MRYSRKFTRQHEYGYDSAAQTKRNTALKASVLSGVMAMCLAFTIPAFAAEITRSNGNSVTPNGNTANYDVYAGKLIAGNTIAVNDFKKFNVNGGDTVNMQFRTAAGAAATDKLVNMVQNQINIAGTVNAIGSQGAGKGDI